MRFAFADCILVTFRCPRSASSPSPYTNLGSFDAARTWHLVYGFYANRCPVNLKCLMHNYEADRGAQELELANTAAQNWILSLAIPLSLSLSVSLASCASLAVVDKTLQLAAACSKPV